MSKFAGVIDVPQSRFYTAIDLYDGTSENEKAGGYVKDASGKNINFMIIQKDAVIQFSKHTVNKIFTPEENQNSEGYIFCYPRQNLHQGTNADCFQFPNAFLQLPKTAVHL